MKKLSLVLALILVFTCCAFVACGDDTTTSSDAGSSAAESSATSSEATSSEAASSDAASSEDASSEAASSDAASSEDASSEDASSEATSSEDTSSEDETSSEAPSVPQQGTAVDNPTGTNVALNKPYTGGDVASAAPTYSANLTDGKKSNVGAYDSSWFGFWFNADATVESNNAPGGVGTIVIDLGKKTDGLTAVRANLWPCNGSGIASPESIVVSVSDDGNSFTEIGALVLPEGDDPAWASLALNGASGQYVKLVFKTNPTASWTFVNEIEVYA